LWRDRHFVASAGRHLAFKILQGTAIKQLPIIRPRMALKTMTNLAMSYLTVRLMRRSRFFFPIDVPCWIVHAWAGKMLRKNFLEGNQRCL
jgi:hypothetical protein